MFSLPKLLSCWNVKVTGKLPYILRRLSLESRGESQFPEYGRGVWGTNGRREQFGAVVDAVVTVPVPVSSSLLNAFGRSDVVVLK